MKDNELKFSFYKGIVIYIISVQMYRLLSNVGHLVYSNFGTHAKIYYSWIILFLVVTFSLYFFRLISHLFLKNSGLKFKYYLYSLVIVISVLNRILIPEIGKYLGKLSEYMDYSIFLNYTTADSWAFMVFNIGIIFFFRRLV